MLHRGRAVECRAEGMDYTMERSKITVDEAKCNGCGACARACAEGVIEITDGKARLVNEDHCDGLGACIGDCPSGAISLVSVTVDNTSIHSSCQCQTQSRGCPLGDISPDSIGGDSDASELCLTPVRQRAVPNWPIQISLVSPTAGWLAGADLLVCADCVAYACPDFHSRHLPGKALLVGCPKFDDRNRFVSRLAEILSVAHVRSIEALHMDVACCRGLARLVEQAQELAGTGVPIAATVVGVDGEVLQTLGLAQARDSAGFSA